MKFTEKAKEKAFDFAANTIDILRMPIMFAVRKAIDARIRKKVKSGEKINVVFVCHRPAVWESLHSVYTAMKNDPFFDVKIVAIPNKKDLPGKGYRHNEYFSEGAEEFWASYGCINGYNYETKKWLDLRTLKPDYVFFQQPYNIARPLLYKSWLVALYAKLAYVPYGLQIVGSDVFESVHPQYFMNSLSFYFCTEKYNFKDLKKLFKKYNNMNFTKIAAAGFTRFDEYLKKEIDDCKLWQHKGKDRKFRITWTPRWCTNEGTCTFFEYKDNIIKYANENDDVEIVFRPHPQAFTEWIYTGEMTYSEQAAFRKECKNCGIIIDENGEYIHHFKTTDCFLTDITSLMGEYMITGKPIIYCHKKDYFTTFGKKLAKGCYITQSWNETEKKLDELKAGNDVLSEKRKVIIQENLYQPKNGAGNNIAACIKADAENKIIIKKKGKKK